jgi:hypothetical protein
MFEPDLPHCLSPGLFLVGRHFRRGELLMSLIPKVAECIQHATAVKTAPSAAKQPKQLNCATIQKLHQRKFQQRNFKP